jgi:hypothetical protein
MISQFFILSPRGDVIIRRDYLGNVPKVRNTVSQITGSPCRHALISTACQHLNCIENHSIACRVSWCSTLCAACSLHNRMHCGMLCQTADQLRDLLPHIKVLQGW